MATRQVFGNHRHTDDTPWPDYRGTIWRAPGTYTEDAIYTEDQINYVTDGAGDWSVDLWVNEGFIATYYVIQWRGEYHMFPLLPGDPVNITQLLGISPGGAGIIDDALIAWVSGDDYEMTAITYDGIYTDVIASATIKWPDGGAGVFTTTNIDSAWHAINSYTITHTLSGKTVTQALVTRNANGDITVKPALSVA